MTVGTVRQYILVFLLGMFFLSVGWCIRSAYGISEPVKSEKHPIRGIFIQLDHNIAGWSEKKWQEEFERMKDLGFREIIIQWCQQEDTKYYAGASPSVGREDKGQAERSRSVIDTIVKLSKKFGIDLYLGLYHDSAYWSQIKGPADVVENYLYHLIDKNLEVAEDLLPLISEFPGFKGFYIPQEVDDVTWSKGKYTMNLKHFIQTLSSRLRQLRPGSKVLMSAFFRGRTSPRYFAELWAELWSEKALDAVMIQDGLGTGEVTPEIVKRYFNEFRNAFKNKKVELWGIVEVFDVVESDGEAFVAKSASLERVKLQASLAGPMTRRLVAFSFRYLSPSSQVPGSEQLFNDYYQYVPGH